MAVHDLGRLEVVDVRSAWRDEARDFTPWLFNNADVLSDSLGIDVELTAREYLVGGYSLDLLGRDLTNDCVLIVENQLETSDHTHLGQVMTYAGGTDASTLVWIAPRFRQEHLAAVEWLNDRTDEDTRLFAIEIGLRRIGDSVPAPFLDLVGKPNDWHKAVKASTGGVAQQSELGNAYLAFWERYVEQVQELHPNWMPQKPSTRNYNNSRLPIRASVLAAAFIWRDKVGMRMWIDSGDHDLNREVFDAVHHQRASFETFFSDDVAWDRRDDRRACDITVSRSGSIGDDEDLLSDHLRWMIATGEIFRSALEAIDLPDHLRA